MMDLPVCLYFASSGSAPEQPDWPDRDRFILSKGHATIGLYAVLALRGHLDLDELTTFDRGDSRRQGHPDVTRLPGLSTSRIADRVQDVLSHSSSIGSRT